MKKFFSQIFNKINQLDKYTTSYQKHSHSIEIPTLAYTNWAMHLAEIKDFESAIKKLETAILMSNQNPKPCISLGVIYAKLKFSSYLHPSILHFLHNLILFVLILHFAPHEQNLE